MTLNPAETILITGAGGFVGGTLVEALHFGGEYRIYAGIARWSSAPRIARLPVKLIQCDVLKPEEVAQACAGVDYVIHCAVGDDVVDNCRRHQKRPARSGQRGHQACRIH